MLQRLGRFIARHADVLGLAIALATIVPIFVWWSIFVRRVVEEANVSERMVIAATVNDPEEATRRLVDVDRRMERRRLMLTGESGLAALLLLVISGSLYAVARQRRKESRDMQTLLALTSHQLKTPIAGVRALLQSLKLGSIPAEVKDQLLDKGVSECDRLEHLVETMLAYQRSVVRPNRKLDELGSAQLLEEIISHRRTTFPAEEVRWEPTASGVLRCDADAVRVVLENLLDNARKYGGGRVELKEHFTSHRWRLEVKDQGLGFPPGEADRLFEPFERGGGTGVTHGSGLGLYIARQLARKMRGDLTATSEGPGKGATFVFELPLSGTQSLPEHVHA